MRTRTLRQVTTRLLARVVTSMMNVQTNNYFPPCPCGFLDPSLILTTV